MTRRRVRRHLRRLGCQALAEGFADASPLFRHEIAYVMGQLQHSDTVPALTTVRGCQGIRCARRPAPPYRLLRLSGRLPCRVSCPRGETLRAAAACGCWSHAFPLPLSGQVLEKLEEHGMVRHEAAEALGAIGMEACVDAIKRFRDDPAVIVAESCDVALDFVDYWADCVPAA